MYIVFFVLYLCLFVYFLSVGFGVPRLLVAFNRQSMKICVQVSHGYRVEIKNSKTQMCTDFLKERDLRSKFNVKFNGRAFD